MSEIYVRFDMVWRRTDQPMRAFTTIYFRVTSATFARDWDLLRSFHQTMQIDAWVYSYWKELIPYEATLVYVKSYAMGKGFSKTLTFLEGEVIGGRFQPGEPTVVDSTQVQVRLIDFNARPRNYVIIPWTYDADYAAGTLKITIASFFDSNVNQALQSWTTYAGYDVVCVLRSRGGIYSDFASLQINRKPTIRRTRRAKL